MIIHEYQAKELLRKYGIPIPDGYMLVKPEDIRKDFTDRHKKVVVKAQVHTGGRGKSGGIKIAGKHDELEMAVKDIIGMNIKGLKVSKVLIEEALPIEKEYYLGITLDRDRASDLIMLSPMGGMDIEEVAKKSPESIFCEYIHPYIGLQDFQIKDLLREIEIAERAMIHKIILSLYDFYIKSDATLAEINPLVFCRECFIAADAKIILDDNALFKHPDFKVLREIAQDDPIEMEAQKKGLAYVKLDGNIGILGNGAGLVMATLDTINQEGGKPANFLDIGGGASSSVVKKSLDLILSDERVKGIFINIFGGITKCDEVARGIVESLKEIELKGRPLIIKLCGTMEDEGKEILKKADIETVDEIKEGAKRIVRLVHEFVQAT